MRERTTATAILADQGTCFRNWSLEAAWVPSPSRALERPATDSSVAGLSWRLGPSPTAPELGEPHPYPLAFGKGRGERSKSNKRLSSSSSATTRMDHPGRPRPLQRAPASHSNLRFPLQAPWKAMANGIVGSKPGVARLCTTVARLLKDRAPPLVRYLFKVFGSTRNDAAIRSSPAICPRPSSMIAATFWKVLISVSVMRAARTLAWRSTKRASRACDVSTSTFIIFTCPVEWRPTCTPAAIGWRREW